MRAVTFRRTVVVTLVVVLVLGGILQFGEQGLVTWVDDLAELVAAAVAGAGCLVLPRRRPTAERRFWLLIGLGLLAWAAGETVWSVYELLLGRATPFPSAADVGFLLFPVLTTAALWMLPWTAASRPGRLRETLDGLIVVCSLFAVSWVVVLGPVYRAGADGPLGTVIGLAYPATDVVLASMLVLALTRVSRAARPVLLLLGAGMLCLAVSDSAFTYLTAESAYVSNTLDLGWIAGFLVIGLAACRPPAAAGAAREDAATPWLVALPYVPLIVCLGVLAARWASAGSLDSAASVAAAMLLVLVLLRQLVAVLDNMRLAVTVRAREGELRWQAFHDPLTGLANRAVFRDRAEHAMALHLRTGRPLTVVYLDLDDFKLVNDGLGHAAGDTLLVSVAERLRATIRQSDTLARLGGDEFALLVEDQGVDGGTLAHRLLDAFAEPFALSGQPVPVRVSLGIADAATALGAGAAHTPDTLLAAADVAMYAAKRQGKGRCAVFTQDMLTLSVTELNLRSDLADAVAQGGLHVAYQPLVSLQTGELIGLEALARWTHPVHGSVPPDRFIPLAERAGLIADLDLFVLNTACAQLRCWLDQEPPGARPPHLSVNVSPTQLAESGLPQRVAATLARHGVPADLLVLEVTESALSGTTESVVAVLHDLRALGVRVAIDDFGTGYSSLSHLHRFPVAMLKVDRSFVADMHGDGAGLVAVVAQIGQTLGIDTVAEGVEEAAQASVLLELGCTLAQGYLFSRPVPAAAVPGLLHRDLRPYVGRPAAPRPVRTPA